MMAVNPYGQDQLMRLLRLLRPAPQGWTEKAKRAIAEMLAQDRTVTGITTLSDADLRELQKALMLDPRFRRSFDADPVAAAEAAGWPELARRMESEIAALVALAERIARDHAYREQLHADPVGTLERSDLPLAAAEQVLHALAVSDDALKRLPEVVGHQQVDESFRSQLVIVLVGSTTVAETLRRIAHRA